MHQGSTWLKLVVVLFFFVFPGPGGVRKAHSEGLDPKKTHEPLSAHGKGTGRCPFSLRRHGRRLELSELFQDSASGHDSRIQEHGKREEGEGVPLWWLRAWEIEVGFGGRGSHSRDNSELVGSSLVAGRRSGAGWGR